MVEVGEPSHQKFYIIITCDDKKSIGELKEFLQSSLRTKDLGKLHYF